MSTESIANMLLWSWCQKICHIKVVHNQERDFNAVSEFTLISDLYYGINHIEP